MLVRGHTIKDWRPFTTVALVAMFAGAMLPLSLRLISAPGAQISPSGLPNFGRMPLPFEPNAGQTDPSVRYIAHASGGTLYFTPSEVVLTLRNADFGLWNVQSDADSPIPQTEIRIPQSSVVRLRFEGASADPKMESGASL